MVNETCIFGVARFELQIAPGRRASMSGQDAIERLRLCLEAVKGVDGLHIAPRDDDFLAADFGAGPAASTDAPLVDLGEQLEISFQLRIPYDAQEQVAGRSIGVQAFIVRMVPEYSQSIAFVELVGGNDIDESSTGVMIVREFLSHEIGSMGDTDIRFGVLGPSPFHADWTIAPSSTPRSGSAIRSRIERRRGYDAVTIKYDPQAFDDFDSVRGFVYESLASELDVYYLIVYQDRDFLHQWAEVENCLQQLEDLQAVGWLRSVVNRMIHEPKLLRTAVANLTMLQTNQILEHTQARQEAKDLRMRGERCHLWGYVRRALEERQQYPTHEVGELLRFYDARSIGFWNRLVGSLTALVGGGAMGAVITLLVTKWKSH